MADMMKLSDVNFARERRGATSPTNVFTIARSAPSANPVTTRRDHEVGVVRRPGRMPVSAIVAMSMLRRP
jgi:hypothetical protein